MYSPFFMPDMRNSLAPWQREVNDGERTAASLPDRFPSKIDASIEFSSYSIVYSFSCRDPCASEHPSPEANHRLEQCSRIRMFPFRNRTWHRSTGEPDRERCPTTLFLVQIERVTKSAILATSIIELMSFRHSMNVIRRLRPANVRE